MPNAVQISLPITRQSNSFFDTPPRIVESKRELPTRGIGGEPIADRAALARTVHEYLLRRPILSPVGAFLVRSPRRTASTPMSALLARNAGGLRSRTPREGIRE